MSYYDCEEAAKVAHCSIFHIREAIKKGALKAYKPAKGYLITPEDLDKWIKADAVKKK